MIQVILNTILNLNLNYFWFKGRPQDGLSFRLNLDTDPGPGGVVVEARSADGVNLIPVKGRYDGNADEFVTGGALRARSGTLVLKVRNGVVVPPATALQVPANALVSRLYYRINTSSPALTTFSVQVGATTLLAAGVFDPTVAPSPILANSVAATAWRNGGAASAFGITQAGAWAGTGDIDVCLDYVLPIE